MVRTPNNLWRPQGALLRPCTGQVSRDFARDRSFDCVQDESLDFARDQSLGKDYDIYG